MDGLREEATKRLSFAVSPCSNPDLTLDEALAAYAALGYRRFEAFTSWVKSALDPSGDPEQYLSVARKHGFEFCSLHLPPMTEDSAEAVARAADACRFAAALGCRAVLVKAPSRELYVSAGKRLLDAIEGVPVIPVLQNHKGSAISSLADYAEVLDGLADPRMKCTLEVGHFHSVGVSWQEGYDLLAGRIELVHIKDQIGAQSVPFGAGEIDLLGLLDRLTADAYAGDVVIEMEVADRANTLQYLGDALGYVRPWADG